MVTTGTDRCPAAGANTPVIEWIINNGEGKRKPYVIMHIIT